MNISNMCVVVCVSDSRVHLLEFECDTYKHWSGSYPEKLHVTYAFWGGNGKCVGVMLMRNNIIT